MRACDVARRPRRTRRTNRDSAKPARRAGRVRRRISKPSCPPLPGNSPSSPSALSGQCSSLLAAPGACCRPVRLNGMPAADAEPVAPAILDLRCPRRRRLCLSIRCEAALRLKTSRIPAVVRHSANRENREMAVATQEWLRQQPRITLMAADKIGSDAEMCVSAPFLISAYQRNPRFHFSIDKVRHSRNP